MVQEATQRMREEVLWLRIPPPARSAVVFVMLFGFAGLLGLAGSKGSADSKLFVDGVPWMVWRGISSASLVVYVVLAVQAIRVLQLSSRWGLAPTRSRRNRYLLCATIGATLIAGYHVRTALVVDLPVENLHARVSAVLLVGLLAGIPWLAVVWLAHAECHDLGGPRLFDAVRPDNYLAAMQDEPGDMVHFGRAVERLLQLWALLLLSVRAFIFGVAAGVASWGALRAAFVATYPGRKSEFPPSNVLLFGGFFALALSIIIVPLLASWRARALELVEHAYPLPVNGRPTMEWIEERHRLEKLLRLDISLLRNPLTASSVIAPVLVSAVAAFLPGVAN